MHSLKPYHTFQLPVNAQQIVRAENIAQLTSLWQTHADTPKLLLGEGSDVLFTTDFHGVVILNRLMGIQHREDQSYHYLHVGAGENWHKLVSWCVEQGYAGLENLALIPGCAGAAPIQNIGAYGVEFKDVCDYVDVLDLGNGTVFRLTSQQCEFSYRESIFKHRYRDGYVITAIGIKLAKDWQPKLDYNGLNQFSVEQVTSRQIFEEVCAIRQAKLPDPKQLGNAGSFFKNPIVSHEHFQKIQQQYPMMPAYLQQNGEVKLAAGWLIDQCGLKGYQVGGAAVHQQQALVLVNLGDASAKDMVNLAHDVRQKVYAKFGVALQPEVRFFAEQGEIDSIAVLS